MPIDALIEQSADSLVNGVSRQPAVQRLPSQAEEQINMLSDVVEGVVRRPPLEHVASLTGDAVTDLVHGQGGDYFTHEIDLGVDGQYLAIIAYGDIHVYDLSDGSEMTVNDSAAGTPGSYTYLSDSSGGELTEKQSFRAVSIGESTYILNRQLRPGVSFATSPGRTHAHEFMLQLKSGAPTSATAGIKIYFDGVEVSAAGGGGGDTDGTMNNICSALTSVTNPSDTVGTAAGSPQDWRFTRYGTNVLHAYQFQGVNDAITAGDDYGDSTHVLVATGTNGEDPRVPKFSDLPDKGVPNFVVLVSGDEGTEEDEFYVEYLEDRSVWKETRRPGGSDTITSVDFPHVLTYNSGPNTFTFGELALQERLVGDDTSAPHPSFTAAPIQDIFIHENRFSLLSGENVVMSEAGNYENFYPTTVTTLIDSDPIDVAGQGGQIAVWDAAIPHDTGVTLFSSTGNIIGDLVGSRNERLTLENARIETRGSFAQSDLPPVAIDRSSVYMLDRGGRTSVYQYQKIDVDLFDSVELTGHVGDYIPGGLLEISPGRAENMMLARAAGSSAPERNTLYVYRFHRIGDERAMASWSKWVFGEDDDIVSVSWIDSVAYFLIIRSDGLHLEKMDFGKADEDQGAVATPLGHRVHLDSLFSATGSYNVSTDETTWTVPYDQDTIGGTYRIVKGGAWGDERASIITVEDSTTDGSIVANGDHTAHPVYIGRIYDSSYELSQIVVRSRSGAGRIGGRLQLRRGRLSYADTGTFTVDTTFDEDDDTYSVIFTPVIVGGSEVGAAPIEDGVFEFDIGGNADGIAVNIHSDSHLPFTLISFEWEGRFYNRASRA